VSLVICRSLFNFISFFVIFLSLSVLLLIIVFFVFALLCSLHTCVNYV
jgi:hypothetical protein